MEAGRSIGSKVRGSEMLGGGDRYWVCQERRRCLRQPEREQTSVRLLRRVLNRETEGVKNRGVATSMEVIWLALFTRCEMR